MVNSSRRKSATTRKYSAPRKTPAKRKVVDPPEAIEENEAEKVEKRPSLTSKSATEGQGAEEQRLTDNKTRSEINANQAAVLSRQNSVTTSQNRENSSNKVNNESELNRTSVSQRASFLQHPGEGTNESNMARAYGKYKNSKDTPNHLYGLDGALMSSDEDAEIDIEDSLRLNSNPNQLLTRLRYFVKDHWKKVLSGLSFFLITGILLAFLVQAHSSWSISRVSEVDPNSETLRKIEEKVDKLSSVLQIIASHNNADSSSADNKSVISEKIVQQIVQEALEKYNADKVGMADFALESSGAQIHGSHHSATYDVGAARVVLFGIPLWFDIKPPRVILQPDNSPGNCWAFKGDQGFVVIKLSKLLTPTDFSLEHIPKLLSPTGDGRIPSAPKEFTVWGWKDPDGNERVKLGYYIFDSEGDFLQTFNLKLNNGTETFQYIELRILSNHGNLEYTCIYRFRVHGNPHL